MMGCAHLKSTRNSLGIMGDVNGPGNAFATTRNKVVLVSGTAAILRSAKAFKIEGQKLTSVFPAITNTMAGPFGLEQLPKCRNIGLMEHALVALSEDGIQPPVEGCSEDI